MICSTHATVVTAVGSVDTLADSKTVGSAWYSTSDCRYSGGCASSNGILEASASTAALNACVRGGGG